MAIKISNNEIIDDNRNIVSANSASFIRGVTGMFIENTMVIANNYTINTGTSALSAGPITVNTGIIVTVPTGSRWVVV